jgi:hypothetical protein
MNNFQRTDEVLYQNPVWTFGHFYYSDNVSVVSDRHPAEHCELFLDGSKPPGTDGLNIEDAVPLSFTILRPYRGKTGRKLLLRR